MVCAVPDADEEKFPDRKMGAEYLIRFDDICPTMNWSVWEQVEQILLSYKSKPILAVIPDNQDPKLKAGEPNPAFWDRVRAWEARGWAIGLHGYQHRYVTNHSGLMGINQRSEFSGLTTLEQQSKLRQALAVFQRERVKPTLWIAPGHSFDATTLDVLRGLGILHVSDGFSLYPYLDAKGMTWVPQQLWRFRQMPFGLWTVCLHVNPWDSLDIARFRSDMQKFAALLTDWHSVISRYQNRRRGPVDSAFWHVFRTVRRTRRWLSTSAPQHHG